MTPTEEKKTLDEQATDILTEGTDTEYRPQVHIQAGEWEKTFDKEFKWFHGTDLRIKSIDTHDAAMEIKQFFRRHMERSEKLVEAVHAYNTDGIAALKKEYERGQQDLLLTLEEKLLPLVEKYVGDNVGDGCYCARCEANRQKFRQILSELKEKLTPKQ